MFHFCPQPDIAQAFFFFNFFFFKWQSELVHLPVTEHRPTIHKFRVKSNSEVQLENISNDLAKSVSGQRVSTHRPANPYSHQSTPVSSWTFFSYIPPTDSWARMLPPLSQRCRESDLCFCGRQLFCEANEKRRTCAIVSTAAKKKIERGIDIRVH